MNVIKFNNDDSIRTEEMSVFSSETAPSERKSSSSHINDDDAARTNFDHDNAADEIGVVLRPKRKNVTFGKVSCRLYDRTAGIHPDVSSGPALTFNWSYRTAPDLSLEEYEAHQGKRLSRTELIIPKHERTKILIYQCGLSKTSIATYVRKVNKFKAQRTQTLQNLPYAKIEEKLQAVRKTVGRALFLRKSQNAQMKKLYKMALELEKTRTSASSFTTSTLSDSRQDFSNLKVQYSPSSSTRYREDILDLDKARHGKVFNLEEKGSYSDLHTGDEVPCNGICGLSLGVEER